MHDDHGVRLLGPDGIRPALDLFRACIHRPPLTDDEWAASATGDFAGRTFGTDDDGEIVGTAASFASRTAVPGGAALPTAAVSRVGVRPDRTRRGHLAALMRAQLDDAVARGDVLATLTASETVIYGRFGYGVATRGEQVAVRSRAGARATAPERGDVRILRGPDAGDTVVALYDRIALRRPGSMVRTADWWARFRSRPAQGPGLVETAVHTGPDGADGYVTWTVLDDDDGGGARVLDMHADGPVAARDLWRFLYGLDLVDRVTAQRRPLDESVDLVLADPREVQVEGRVDELWLRLLDVGAALAARSWGDGAPVVLRVHDHLLPDNDGAYRIGPGGAEPAGDTGAVDLECTVDALAMAYLGDRRPSDLVATGWWRAHDPAAAARADALFATGGVPWCGTFF